MGGTDVLHCSQAWEQGRWPQAADLAAGFLLHFAINLELMRVHPIAFLGQADKPQKHTRPPPDNLHGAIPWESLKSEV